MPTSTLGPGSKAAGVPALVQDFSFAGMATRVMTASPPTDADWGLNPPPDGTMVVALDGFLWVRVNGAWNYVVLQPSTQ